MTWFGTRPLNASAKFYVDINGIETSSVKKNEVVRNGLKLKLSKVIVSFKSLFLSTNSENKVKPAASPIISGPFNFEHVKHVGLETESTNSPDPQYAANSPQPESAGRSGPQFRKLSLEERLEWNPLGKMPITQRPLPPLPSSISTTALQGNETSATTPESLKARPPRSLREKRAQIMGDTVVRQSYEMSSNGDVKAARKTFSSLSVEIKSDLDAPKKRNGIVMGTTVLSGKTDAAKKPPTALAVLREKNNIVMGQRALESAIPLSGAPRPSETADDAMEIFVPPRENGAADPHEPGFGLTVLPLPVAAPRRSLLVKQPPVAASRPSLLAKASPREISAEEWDPIAAGKSAAPVTLTEDPKALAMAARFANAVNGPITRRPIPEGERIKEGGVSAARSFFEKMSNRSE